MIVVDVETTGLVPHRHGIISLGAVNFKHPEHYFYAIGKPHPSVEVNNRALEVNGITREELQAYPDTAGDIVNQFIAWVNTQDPDTSRLMAGHNVGFDYFFLLAEMDRWGIPRNNFPFKHRTIDLHTAAQTDYVQKKGFTYFNDMPADFIQKKLGLPVEPTPHHALNGAIFESECFSRLWFGKHMFEDFKDIPIKANPWT